MFADAVERAIRFTRPVVTSVLFMDDTIDSGPATFVILNKEGYFVTAEHVVQPLIAAQHHATEIARYEQAAEQIRATPRQTPKQVKRRIAQLKGNPRWIRRISLWFGADNLEADVRAFPMHDVAIGKFKSFDPAWVPEYPKFRDPATLRLGTSLCRVGFALSQTICEYDTASGRFKLNPESLSIFPVEGIYSRDLYIETTDTPPERTHMFETSSPGLRGQSGGPLVDTAGNVCGIQSRTSHYVLGFSPKVNRNGQEHVYEQFLNAGWAVHNDVLFNLLRTSGISFEVA